MPASVAATVMSTLCAVSLVVAPATSGTVTASRTARNSSMRSGSVRTGLSPVVPARTKPSLPWSTSHRASRAAASRSSAPWSSNGVTIAVRTAPKRAIRRSRSSIRTSTRPYRPGRGAPGKQSASGELGGLGELGVAQGERLVLVAGVGEILELDHAQLLEAVPQPLVVAIEQPQLLAVRDDLGEQHLLEEQAVRVLDQQRQDLLGLEAHALPHLLLHEPVAHAPSRLERELLTL